MHIYLSVGHFTDPTDTLKFGALLLNSLVLLRF